MNQSNCMVAQSGGPTVAINASLAGVIDGVMRSGKYATCYGSVPADISFRITRMTILLMYLFLTSLPN